MKKFTFLMAMVLGFALNAMAINPYAYGVSVAAGADNYTVNYSLNAEAAAVALELVDATDNVVASIPMTGLTAGAHNETVTIPATVPAGTYTAKVAVTGAAHDFQTSAVEGKSYTGRIHATVDPYPTSAGFGNIYVTSRDGNERGMFYITPDYTYVSTTVERFGKENADWGSCQRGAVAPNGEMWYSSWSDGNSGIHRYDPAAATPAVTQFFLGTRDASSGLFVNEGAETGCSTPGIGFYVDGANTKLYMVAEDFTGGSTKGSLAIYNIGQPDGSIVTSWGVAPSAHYNVLTDKDGTNFAVAATPYGAWICQHRALGSNAAGARSLQFITNAGVQTFLSTDTELINGSLGAGIVTNAAADKLWMVNGNGNLMQFSVAWAEGVPTLTKDTTYTTPFSAASQLTFDFAGNIVASVDNGGSYVSGSTKMGVTVISLPAAEATVVETPVVGFECTVAAAPAAAITEDIYLEFKGSTTDQDLGTAFTLDADADASKYIIVNDMNQVFAQGASYVAGIATEKVYPARNTLPDAVGVKFGSSSAVGYMDIKLNGTIDAKAIVVISAGYGDAEYGKFSVNGTTVQHTAAKALNKVWQYDTIPVNAVIDSICIHQLTASKGRFYFKGVKVLYNAGSVTPVEPEIIWSDFLGDGAADGAYNNTYKYGHTEDQTAISVVNIQHPGFATADGIYLTAPAAIDACSLTGYEIQGGGICVHLSNFTAKVTEFTITCGTNVYTCYVWNENGTDVPTGFEAIQTEKAVKFFRNGQIYIQKGDAVYTISGVRVE